MFEVKFDRVRALEGRLDALNQKAIPFAQRNTINDLAFATQAQARADVREKFINRNTWTERSIRVDRARSTHDSAEVGSTEEYMADQEFGAVGGPRHVPTPAAAGQSNRAAVRTRVVRRRYRMPSIQLGRRKRVRGDQAQQNIAAVRQAKEAKQKFVYLERGKRKGIYEVRGTKRKPRTRMVQDLSRQQRVVRPRPWLTPATEAVAPRVGRLYATRLREQLRRMR